jgi:hypothetical protein
VARIPLGDFGNAIAAPQRGAQIPQGAFGDSRGLQQLGDTGIQIAAGIQQEQRIGQQQQDADDRAEIVRQLTQEQAELKRDQEQLASAQRMKAYVSYNADIDDYTSNMIGNLASNKIKRDDVFTMFEKDATELQRRRLEGLDPISQETVKAHMITGQRAALNRLRGAVRDNVRQEQGALILSTKEELQRIGVKDPETAITQFNRMLDQHGPGRLNAEEMVKEKQAFAEHVFSTHYIERLTAVEKNPAAVSGKRGPVSFESIIPGVFKREGGFVASDGAGGAPANFGINQAANPDINVKNLTKEQATEIYRKRYWTPINGDKLAADTAIVAFDAAVNQGVGYAQNLIKETGGDPQKMLDQRERDYRALAKDPKHAPFLGGWLNRLMDVKREVANSPKTGDLESLARDVIGNPTLDPDRKNVIAGRINGIRERLSSASERLDKARMDGIARQISEVDDLILNGSPPNAQQLLAIKDAAKGTPYEDTVKSQAQFATAMSGFLEMNPQAQQAAVNEMSAAVAANPSKDGIKTRDAMRTIFNNQTELVRKDPQTFAAQRGLYPVEPIDITNIATLPEQVQKRVVIAEAMNKQYGSPMQVFNSQEIDMVKQSFSGMLPDKKAVALEMLAKGIRDPRAIRDTAAQLDKQDKSLATALFLSGKGLYTEKGRNLATLYLAGDDALDTKKVKADPFVLADIQQRLDGVYSTADGRNTAVDVAMKVWAAGQSGKLGGLTGVGDVIEVATGGLMTWNDRKIAKPYGMKDSEFQNKINAMKLANILEMSGGADKFRVGSKEVTAAEVSRMLPGAKLQTVGDGAYSIMAGPDYVRLPNNRPLVIQVR